MSAHEKQTDTPKRQITKTLHNSPCSRQTDELPDQLPGITSQLHADELTQSTAHLSLCSPTGMNQGASVLTSASVTSPQSGAIPRSCPTSPLKRQESDQSSDSTPESPEKSLKESTPSSYQPQKQSISSTMFRVTRISVGFRFLWKIPDFALREQHKLEYVETDEDVNLTFDAKAIWKARFYPHGRKNKMTNEHNDVMGFYLYFRKKASYSDEVCASVQFRFLDEKRSSVLLLKSRTFNCCRVSRYGGYVDSENVFDPALMIASDGSLIMSWEGIYWTPKMESIKEMEVDFFRLLQKVILGWEQMSKKENNDIILVVGKKEIPVTMSDLMKKNHHFEELFGLQYGFYKSFKGNYKLPVNVDIEPEVFNEILHYIYTGGVSEKFSTFPDKVMRAAYYYNLQTLVYTCDKILSMNLRPENVSEYFILAYEVRAMFLMKECARFINFNGRAVYKSESWKILENNHEALVRLVKYICKMDD